MLFARNWTIAVLLALAFQFAFPLNNGADAHQDGLGSFLSSGRIGVQSALSRYGGLRTLHTDLSNARQHSAVARRGLKSTHTNKPHVATLVSNRKRILGRNTNRDESSPNERICDESTTSSSTLSIAQKVGSGGAAAVVGQHRPLEFWETMLCGAISRSTAQTIMHPANTMKTMLQNSKGPVVPAILELMKLSSFHRLTYGAGTNFLLSVPQGALNFSVLEFVRRRLGHMVAANPYLAERSDRLGAGLDFVSSSISTVVCSVVATPQMMITDNIMAGNYPNLFRSVEGLAKSGGIKAFYRGWLPAMVGKIPSYALTWTLFQQFKALRDRMSHRPAKNIENSIMGCLASATSVCVMIPMDTIKTRLVTQGGAASISRVPYKGIVDCAIRVYKEEGIGAFYRSLPPRLVSVVPLIGIQFTVYEAMKKFMMMREIDNEPVSRLDTTGSSEKSPVTMDKAEEEAVTTAGLER